MSQWMISISMSRGSKTSNEARSTLSQPEYIGDSKK